MAFLDKVRHRQPEIAELGGHRDDQPHMGDDDLVQRILVVSIFPAQRQFMLRIPFQIGSGHRRPDHDTPCPVFNHCDFPVCPL